MRSWKNLLLVMSALALGILPLSSCSGSDDSAEPSAPPAETAETDTADFCAAFLASQGEVEESYVGSQQHIDDVQAMADAAPPAVKSNLIFYRDYLASDEFDPEANVIDDFPPNVQTAISEIASFGDENC